MAVILYKDDGVTTRVEPKQVQAHLDNGWRLTKEAPKKRGRKPKAATDERED